MSSHIYILTDGTNTKIGKTISFDKRMASYNTHNANVQLVKKYPCSEEEATRIETLIKNIFKDNLVGKGKEWFSVPSGDIDRYVSTLLFKATTSDIKPSNHGVNLTQVALQLKDEILSALADGRKHDNDIRRSAALRSAYYTYMDENDSLRAEAAKKEYEEISKKLKAYDVSVANKKEQLATLFANKFQLGIPEHKLPIDDIQIKDGINADLNHCDLSSDLATKSVINNHIQMPFDYHNYRFFHLYKLPTGYYIAFCSAMVSMPYIEALSDENQEKIFEAASTAGWQSTIHNDWSWHYPNKTGLILYQPKTPISEKINLFETSFRKWVIENQVILQQEKFGNKKWLKKVIEDISYDNTFPFDVNTFEELCAKYLEVFWYITPDEVDGAAWQNRAYKLLFEKWNSSK